ncbi:MAG: hypothetical protein QM817_33000 [Archangium sp.]
MGIHRVDERRWLVSCRTTRTGDGRLDAISALVDEVARGALDEAEEIEFALATLGGNWHAKSWVQVLTERPKPRLKRISFGPFFRPLDVERLREHWALLPQLEHGPETSWRAATRPRLEVFAVGPHFLQAHIGQVFELLADGTGPWLTLREPALFKAGVSSDNIVEIEIGPLEFDDEVRVNGERVELNPCWVYRGLEKTKHATMSWVAMDGDTFEVLGLGLRYREDVAADGAAFANREPVVAMMNGGGSTTIELAAAAPPRELDDDDE